jgi:23S rRNA (uracil1939-C5)-methyltransferase
MTTTTTRVHEGAIVEVTIEGVDDEGRGRGTLVDHDVAVRGALPGDVVQARIDRVWPARNLSQARAVTFSARSTLHVARDCPHAAPCPGCPFEGVDRGFALAFKRARVEQALVDVGFDAATIALVDDVVPSRAPRQKAKLSVGGRAGALRFGLFVPHSHHLVDTDECPHVAAEILDAIAVLADVLDDAEVPPATIEPRGLKAIVARVFMPHGGLGPQPLRVGVVLVMGGDVDERTWRALTAVRDHLTLASLAVRVDDGAGNSIVGGRITRSFGPQMMPPLELGPDASVDAFCQTDAALANEMYRRAARFLLGPIEELPNLPRGTYVDAYAGAGGFARAIVRGSLPGQSSVVAIERADEGVRTLRMLENVEAIASSVEDALPALLARAGSFAGVVADPPKSGLRDAARGLAQLNAKRFVLVACDPDAGARDAKVLVDAGYTLVHIEPLDLFPATTEVETMFFLTRP